MIKNTLILKWFMRISSFVDLYQITLVGISTERKGLWKGGNGSSIPKKQGVDTKINTLESEGKCSPSSGKSTKRASQFDLESTRERTKSNSRAYWMGFRMSLTQAYRQAMPIQ